MILGTNEKGEGVLTLSKREYDRLKQGKQIKKEGAYAKGKFRITVTYEEWPRGWVFVEEGKSPLKEKNHIGFAPADEYQSADHAVQGFLREWGGDEIEIYFRDTMGQYCTCADESTPEDFQ